jgi:hypothetical protein
MQARTKSMLLQVYLAVVCAFGAGMSGDMLASTAGHASHHARHSRGTHARGTRTNGRDSQGDHAQEIEVVQDGPTVTAAAQPDAVAILPKVSVFAVAWFDLGLVPAIQAGFVATVDRLHLPARAPPAVA